MFLLALFSCGAALAGWRLLYKEEAYSRVAWLALAAFLVNTAGVIRVLVNW